MGDVIIKQSTYLYGDSYNPAMLHNLPYMYALILKIYWSRELVEQLLAIPYMERDMRRINDSLKAQKFNQTLIDECLNA